MPAASPRRNRPQRYIRRLLIQLDAEVMAEFEAVCPTLARLSSFPVALAHPLGPVPG
jgi:hypothetical protein